MASLGDVSPRISGTNSVAVDPLARRFGCIVGHLPLELRQRGNKCRGKSPITLLQDARGNGDIFDVPLDDYEAAFAVFLIVRVDKVRR